MATFGSLFAGIGGMDLGLERAGWECRWQVEINDFCRQVLTKHWQGVPKHADIFDLTGDELESVDLICAGPPCQPVSVAGKRLGEHDPRWLWPEFFRVVRAVRPRILLVENPPGIFPWLGDILGELAACGFDAEWDCIPAAAVGAPHLRDRLFIVAYTRSTRPGSEQAPRALQHRASATPIRAQFGNSIGWAPEPNVPRVDARVPRGLDRRSALGNAVVPQVAEWIGRRILAADAAETSGVAGAGGRA